MNNSGDWWSQLLNIPSVDDGDEPQRMDPGNHQLMYPGQNLEWPQTGLMLPHTSGYTQIQGAFANPHIDIKSTNTAPVDPNLTQLPPMGATTIDSPPANTGFFGNDLEASSNGTDGDSASSRANSPAAYSDVSGNNHVSHASPLRTQKTYVAKSNAPYSTSKRPHRRQSSGEPDTVAAAFTCSFERPVPDNAVFGHSPHTDIRAEMSRLSKLLRDAGLSQSKHHPYMTCPVYNCWRGGYNPLLHGPVSIDPSPPVGSSDSDHLAAQRPGFFMTNEILRHVRDKHLADASLRCNHVGCATQQKLDKRAGGPGKGRFSRPDVLRTHLEENLLHRASVTEELRVKYKLWKEE